ncbi:MAG: hypothetical protein EXX96DRAFT_492950 [Benjaminiella poitrasii]|nr:MAG: hypothetical protein EXX96DRAFT_492950 [Benjaminiella poitrasii]
MCLPAWLAYLIWFIVAAVIICIIVIGALLGSFRLPSYSFIGLDSIVPAGVEQFQATSTGFNINVGLLFNIINPNALGLKLSNITAKVYYYINGRPYQMGIGFLDYEYIPKHSNVNFTFPFIINYNSNDANSKALLSSIEEKCGLNGESTSNIDITYDVALKAQVLFVKVYPAISSSSSFACPIQVTKVNLSMVFIFILLNIYIIICQ